MHVIINLKQPKEIFLYHEIFYNNVVRDLGSRFAVTEREVNIIFTHVTVPAKASIIKSDKLLPLINESTTTSIKSHQNMNDK